MKIVIWGATGFLGRHLLKKLENTGLDVTGITRQKPDHPALVQVADYSSAPVGDVVFHFAENKFRHMVQNNPGESEASLRRMEYLLSQKPGHIFYASSAAVYGENSEVPHCENELLSPHEDLYAQSKLNCESMLDQTHSTILRLANLYGPDMGPGNVISVVMDQISQDCAEPIKIYDKTPRRDFMWIEDTTDAIVKLLNGRHCGIYNVGSGHSPSIGEVVEYCLKAGQQEGRRIIETQKALVPSCIALDIEKISSDLSWQPKTTIKQGIYKLIQGHG